MLQDPKKYYVTARACRARIGATDGAFFNQLSHSRARKSLINEYIQTIPHDGQNRNMPRARRICGCSVSGYHWHPQVQPPVGFTLSTSNSQECVVKCP